MSNIVTFPTPIPATGRCLSCGSPSWTANYNDEELLCIKCGEFDVFGIGLPPAARLTHHAPCVSLRKHAHAGDGMAEGVEREEKIARLQWVDMLTQLRFGSPTAPGILPGQCQDMLDYLVDKYAPGEPYPRLETHRLLFKKATAAQLRFWLPQEDWALKRRPPHSNYGHPIFLGKTYLDGRRRINTYYEADPDQIVYYWRLEPKT